jgi:SAM-dependent methyltransferase
MTTTTQDPTLAAYESLAPFYDSYTHTDGHERWLGNLERIALGHGLLGSRLLDVGCGTGKSFMPMVRRGYDVTAFDISPAMVERARALAGDAAEVLVADARELPVLGRFDLVTSINDSLNYLLTEEELLAAFRGIAANLRPGGLFVFDLNTLGAYRHFFARDIAMEVDGAFFCWRGESDADAAPGLLASSVVEVFSSDDGESWHRTRSRHVQRHHPPELVERVLGEAGFDLLERRGQVTGACIDPIGDEQVHRKLDYFARRVTTDRETASGEGVIAT